MDSILRNTPVPRDLPRQHIRDNSRGREVSTEAISETHHSAVAMKYRAYVANTINLLLGMTTLRLIMTILT